MINLLKLPHQLGREALTCRAIVETPRGHRSNSTMILKVVFSNSLVCFLQVWLSLYRLASCRGPERRMATSRHPGAFR
jgi:hypothetical protein